MGMKILILGVRWFFFGFFIFLGVLGFFEFFNLVVGRLEYWIVVQVYFVMLSNILVFQKRILIDIVKWSFLLGFFMV